MEFFSTIFEALNAHPTAALLVLSLLALGYLWRDSRKRDEQHAEALRAAHAAHLQTALQVAPLAQKLVTCVEILERLTPRAST